MNGGDKLNEAQLAQFNELQDAFRAQELWVGWNDSDPETAEELTIEDDADDGSQDSIDDDGSCLAYVLNGKGDPDELADEYVDVLRTQVS